jgi:hypothetical protein
MLDTNAREVHSDRGLTAPEQRRLKIAEPSLPTGWCIALDENELHEVYARVLPPWNTELSAFLIDREAREIILTDNISADTRPVISVLGNVQDAIDRVAAVIFGHGGTGAPTKAMA